MFSVTPGVEHAVVAHLCSAGPLWPAWKANRSPTSATGGPTSTRQTRAPQALPVSSLGRFCVGIKGMNRLIESGRERNPASLWKLPRDHSTLAGSAPTKSLRSGNLWLEQRLPDII
jgi:hypothetical protein